MDGFSRSRRSPEWRFGVMITAALGMLGASEVIRGADQRLYVLLLAASVAVGLLTLLSPGILRPLNNGWLLIGNRLGRITSPVVLSVIFFGLLTPIACVCRLCGRDELHLRRSESGSYWITRSQPMRIADSFKNPF